MQEMENRQVKIVNADPAALGLFGLAMVTLVASSQKFGITQGTSFVLPWAIFLGSFAQLFACFNDSQRNNIFGTTAFGAYGLFWLAVGVSWLIKMGALGEALAKSMDERQFSIAIVGYLIFTLYMTVGSMETNKVLFGIFVLIDFLFLGLALSGFGIAKHITHPMAAWAELLISILSFYGSAAVLLNQHLGRTLLPLGKPFGILKKQG